VVKHDMSVAANRAWIIDVGRGGEGGRIVASGTTETDLPEPESQWGGWATGSSVTDGQLSKSSNGRFS